MDGVGSKPAVGDLKISQDVVAAIARVAALEIEGVDSLADSVNMGGFFSRTMMKKAINITLNDNFVNIGISLNLESGAKIPEVCTAVQTSVKDNVQTMTGMAVSKINVFVAGIVFPETKAE